MKKYSYNLFPKPLVVTGKEKTKRGTGYYRFVLPVSYNFKSYDMFFHSETGIIRLINTDCRRAIKIAEFFKSKVKLDYTLELTQ